ncbi:type I methionyl aminopeptidase [Candidatus Gracilibacteria bacterium]|nr:type I methionyl aminopeptidase [Candidatus Gracilibacteria bacterium]
MNIAIKTSQESNIMRYAGRLLQDVQELLKKHISEGVSLLELDRIAEERILAAGAVPSFKGYQGFPKTLCTMINSEVVHGIPDNRQLQKGDLLSVDCGVYVQGFHADAAFSVIIGGEEAHPERAKFSRCVREALLAGCDAARAGNRIGDIGAAIEHIVVRDGYSVCREYTGHGLGRELHEDPFVYNYGTPKTGEKLVKGMTIAIEPIIASGSPRTKTLSDGWTVVTVDGRDACQWEHCGVVTEKGFEIFA